MLFHRLLPVAFLALALVGCDNADPDPATPPPVIAPAAFAFDTSFPDDSQAKAPYGAYFNAALRVVGVTLVVGTHLVVPAAATEAATEAEPFVEDGTWIWENTVSVQGSPVTVRLEGTPEGRQIDWRMLVSASDLLGEVYDGFELYDGTTTLDGRSGSWRLYYRIEGERTEVLDADFEVTSADVREISFTVPESNPNPDARGGSVRYAADAEARLFDWHEPEPDHTHLVEWDAATRAGALTAWNYLDGERACWDEHLEDVACE